MKAALQRVTVFVASIAAAVGALAQEPAFPAGRWEAVASETYTSPLHPVLTGAEFYLKVQRGPLIERRLEQVRKTSKFRHVERIYPRRLFHALDVDISQRGRRRTPC